MEAILNAEPESLSVNQLKSVLFENGEFIPQVPTPKATFVKMFKELQKKVSANPSGQWRASILTEPSLPPKKQQLKSSPQTTPGKRSSGFELRSNVLSVVVPFPPSTPDQSMGSFPQSPVNPSDSSHSNTLTPFAAERDGGEMPIMEGCNLDSVFYDTNIESKSFNNENNTINNFNDDDDDDDDGGIFMVQSPPSSDDSSEDDDYGNMEEPCEYNYGSYRSNCENDDDEDNIHEHPNYGVQDSLSEKIWDKFKSNFIIIAIITLVLVFAYRYSYLHPYDLWSKIIPNNSELSKELLLVQVSRTLMVSRGEHDVCGWGNSYVNINELVHDEAKLNVWDKLTTDDLDRYDINIGQNADTYYVSYGKVMFLSKCFFYDNIAYVNKILVSALLFILSKRLIKRMN